MNVKRVTFCAEEEAATPRTFECVIKFKDSEHFEGFAIPDGPKAFDEVWDLWREVENFISESFGYTGELRQEINVFVDLPLDSEIDLDFSEEEPEPHLMQLFVECERSGKLKCFKLNVCFKDEEQYTEISGSDYHTIGHLIQEAVSEIHSDEWCLTGLVEANKELEEEDQIDLDVTDFEQ